MSTAPTSAPADAAAPTPSVPPVLNRMLRGSFWLAMRTPLQAILFFVSVPLTLRYIGTGFFGAYSFSWGFGFIQYCTDMGMGAALQRQLSDRWMRNDMPGVRRTIASGLTFYLVLSVVQIAALSGVAFWAVPYAGFSPAEQRLIVWCLMIQAAAAPFFGLSMIVNYTFQAACRYDFLPRLDMLVILARFLILVVGIQLRASFVLIVAAQVAAQLIIMLGPSLWVSARELHVAPSIREASWAEFRGLFAVSTLFFLMQISHILSNSVDTSVLGFVLPEGVANTANAVYQIVNKPRWQIWQMGVMLTSLVMPAVASLAAAGRQHDLERLKYDGTRLIMGVLLPIVLLAGLEAAPFLMVWVGADFVGSAWLMQLFLVAVLPIFNSVMVQMVLGLGRIRFLAFSALAGALLNLPISIILTIRLQSAAGVIWGTVLTSIFANLLVPGWYAFRVLQVHIPTYVRRTLSAPLCGAVGLLAVVVAWRLMGLSADPAGPTASWLATVAPGPERLLRALPLIVELAVGCFGYLCGYLCVPYGRDDLRIVGSRFFRRS